MFYGQWTKFHVRSQMEQSLWQTIISFDLLHSSYMWTHNIVMRGNLQNSADHDCFKTPTLWEISRTRNRFHKKHYKFGSHTFVPISCMFKKQTSVSHRTTESEIISLDARLRLDGILALDLRDQFVESDSFSKHESVIKNKEACQCLNVKFVHQLTLQKRKQSRRVIDDLDNVDFFPKPQIFSSGNFGGCSTLANSISVNSTSSNWPKSNWPKSKLAEVEIGRSRTDWPKSKLAEVEIGRSRTDCGSLVFFFFFLFFFFSFFFFFFFLFFFFLFFFSFSLFLFLFVFLYICLFFLFPPNPKPQTLKTKTPKT